MAEEKKARPPKRAAALRYDPAAGPAPEVVAAGQGEVAERIVATARAAGVPVYRDAALAETLVRLGVGVEIPPELYAAVAEVLAWVATVDSRRAARWREAAGPR